MTSYRNTATIDATPGTGDRARVRQLLPALVLALAVAFGAAAAIGVTTQQPAEVAPSYQGDWKDTLVGGSAARDYDGDWKDAFIGSGTAPARTHSGDWKDLFLPEVAGR